MCSRSTFYRQEQKTYLWNNSEWFITIYNVAELFGKTYLKAATYVNAISASRIFPKDLHVCTKEMFAADVPTDFPLTATPTLII